METNEMKGRLSKLKQTLTNLNIDLEEKIKNINEIKRKIKVTSIKIEDIEAMIDQRNNKDIVITEHAIITYFERILGYNIKDIKNKILSEEIKNNFKITGDGIYKNKDFSVKIKNNTVMHIKI